MKKFAKVAGVLFALWLTYDLLLSIPAFKKAVRGLFVNVLTRSLKLPTRILFSALDKANLELRVKGTPN